MHQIKKAAFSHLTELIQVLSKQNCIKMPRPSQNSKHSDRSVFEHAFQSFAGHNQEETVHNTLDTPSSDFQHALQTCSDHNSEETSLHKGDTS